MNSFNFPILTPPFINPGTRPTMPAVDPYGELNDILNRVQGQQFQLPQESTLQTILNSIAGGAAVLASPDPGGTLQNQLNQKQVRKDKVAQINAERQNQLDLVRINTAIEKAKAMTEEQAQIRKEGREQTYRDKDVGRELKIYSGKKQTDLATQEQGFRLEQNLLKEYQPLIEARLKNEVYLRDMPQQRKDSIEWQALARTALPNLDPTVAKVIGDKLSGSNQTPLTIEENDLVKKVNQETNKQFQTEREAKIGKIKAETFRDIQEGLYAKRDKPGGISQQNTFGNAYNRVLGQELASAVDDTYYVVKNPDGSTRLLSLDELRSVDYRKDPAVLSAQSATPEQNLQEMQRRVQKVKAFKQQQDAELQQQGAVKATDISPKAQQVLEYARSQNYTPEQTKVLLNSNGIPIEEINKLVPAVGQQQQSQFAPTDIPTPLLEYGQQRPRQVSPISNEDRKSFEALQKAVEKERNKRRAKN